MTQDEIAELFLNATRECPLEQQIRFTETFLELPLGVLLFVQELPPETHLLALQSSYIGYVNGKAEARTNLVTTFLATAGFENVVLTGESGDIH